MIFNAISRSRAAFGTFVGQLQRSSRISVSCRKLCSKPQEVPVPTQPQRAAFKMPGYRPSEMDKRMLVWTGRFKSKKEIPEQVSFEMIDAARDKMRIKACYVMIALTVASCLVMVILGKQAAGRHESLASFNMEKKARLREEAQREKEKAASLTEKKTQ